MPMVFPSSQIWTLKFIPATGIDVHIITPIVCGICIFYTSLGGLKALVWIDSIQFVVTFGIVLMLLVLGITSHGGLSNMWNLPPVRERMDILEWVIFFRKSIWRDTDIGFFIHSWWIKTSNKFKTLCIYRRFDKNFYGYYQK